jgi:hypothetical protein
VDLTTQDTKIRLYAGLYLRTPKQTRFWGWSSKGWSGKGWWSKGWASNKWASWGWGSLRAVEVERPWAGLAEWLRLAHARLDGNSVQLPAQPNTQIEGSLTPGALEHDAQERSR